MICVTRCFCRHFSQHPIPVIFFFGGSKLGTSRNRVPLVSEAFRTVTIYVIPYQYSLNCVSHLDRWEIASRVTSRDRIQLGNLSTSATRDAIRIAKKFCPSCSFSMRRSSPIAFSSLLMNVLERFAARSLVIKRRRGSRGPQRRLWRAWTASGGGRK